MLLSLFGQIGFMLLVFSPMVYARLPGLPEVRLIASGQIMGVAAENHKPLKREMRILETEECNVSRVSDTLVKVSESCGYARGIFSYQFVAPGTKDLLEVYMGFSVSRKNPRSHVFMASTPIVISGLSEAVLE